jgi:Flp pilus assembly pilin Flp
MIAMVQVHQQLRATCLARNCATDVGGATSIEYGLIAMLLGVSIVGVMGTVGSQVSELFLNVASYFPN